VQDGDFMGGLDYRVIWGGLLVLHSVINLTSEEAA
jgi:hypothetical protein